VRAAQELLGAPTILVGGSALPEGCGGGSQRSQIILQSRPKCKKTVQTSWFNALVDLKITENAVFFYLIVLNKIYSQDVF
jgi:phosphoribosylformylglycinamidine (FGAM) synthase-like enzyme